MKRYKDELNTIQSNESFKQHLKKVMRNEKIEKTPSRIPIVWQRFALISLCFMIISAAIWYLHLSSSFDHQKDYSQLEKLTIGKDDFMIGGLGAAGTDLPDIEDFIHNNPYDLNHPTKEMPVFKNQMSNEVAPYSEEEAKKILSKYADMMGVTDYTFVVNDIFQRIDSPICSIEILAPYTLYVSFTEAYLKEHSYILDGTSKEEIQKQTESFVEKEKQWFYNGDVHVDVNNHSLSGTNGSWDIRISKKGKNNADTLVNNQMNYSTLYYDENNVITGFRINITKAKQLKEKYPIKSLEEAKKDLLEGNSFHYGKEGNVEEIAYVEMIYHMNRSTKYYLPYYHFYVPAKDQDFYIYTDNTVYLEYFVCAISDEFINNELFN